MTPVNVPDAVRQALLSVVPDADLDRLDPDADLRDELGLDSLDFLNFVEGLSERTGCRIDEDDYDRLDTLDACVSFLSRQLA
jgi:acyl carrier protein